MLRVISWAGTRHRTLNYSYIATRLAIPHCPMAYEHYRWGQPNSNYNITDHLNLTAWLLFYSKPPRSLLGVLIMNTNVYPASNKHDSKPYSTQMAGVL